MPAFSEHFRLPLTLTEARTKLANDLTPILARRGFGLASQDELSLRYEYRYCPGWARVAGVLTFWTIIGLAFFAVRRTDHVLLALNPDGEGTNVTASGDAAGAVARSFRELRD